MNLDSANETMVKQFSKVSNGKQCLEPELCCAASSVDQDRTAIDYFRLPPGLHPGNAGALVYWHVLGHHPTGDHGPKRFRSLYEVFSRPVGPDSPCGISALFKPVEPTLSGSRCLLAKRSTQLAQPYIAVGTSDVRKTRIVHNHGDGR